VNSAEASQPDAAEATRAMTMYGETVTRAGTIFAIGMLALLPFGMVSLAITTRYLDPTDYGHLAVLFAISSILAQFAGLGLGAGAFYFSYRATGDDDGDGDGVDDVVLDEDLGETTATAAERMRMLGSGIMAVLVSNTIICGAVALLGAPIAALIFGLSPSSLAWAAASAGASGVYRTVHQIPRMERKPVAWAVIAWLRPGLVVAGTVAALAAGLGVNGVLMATAAGTLLTIVGCLIVYRGHYRLDWHRGDLKKLWSRGRRMLLFHLGYAIQGNASILLLGILAAPASVALFTVATRIAQIPTYFGEGLLLGWPALQWSQIGIAAKERKGQLQYQALFFTLFALCTLGLLVAVSLLADTLIYIAAPEYQSAADLIPIVAVSMAAAAMFRGVYRATRFRRKRFWFMLLHVVWVLPFGATAALLVGWSETYGVAIAQVVAGVVVAVCLVLLDRRAGDPTPFQWKRLAIATALGGACVAAVQLSATGGALHAALSVVALALFPILVLATGAVRRGQVGIVRSIVASVLPRRLRKREMRRRLVSMPETEREALLLVACEHREPEAAAASLGVTEPVVSARLTRGLRHFANGDTNATPIDHLIGEYVTHPGGAIERDTFASTLHSSGVDPLQLHLLEDALDRVSRLKADKVRGDLVVSRDG
jgi:O-antigen/teichoic acid export membrane protein